MSQDEALKEREEKTEVEKNEEETKKANEAGKHESAAAAATAAVDESMEEVEQGSSLHQEEESLHNADIELQQEPADPHDLIERYVEPQLSYFEGALHEINSGCKQSCWLWFILPTPPFIVNGVERGSPMNRYFALRNDQQCVAYLQYEQEGVRFLRQNYLTMLAAIERQLHRMTLTRLLGSMDDNKAVSSFKLFERVGGMMGDDELSAACKRVLRLSDNDKKKRAMWRRRA